MKNYLVLILSILIFSCNQQEKVTEGYLLRGAVIYDGNGKRIEDTNIAIKEGRIDCIGDCPNDGTLEELDLQGKFITPGMVDAHVHFFQTGFYDSRPDALNLTEVFPPDEVYAYQAMHPDRYYMTYLKSGVTAVYDVGGMPWSIALQKSAENNLFAPHVAASGTLITPAPEERIAIFNNPTEKVMVHLSSAEVGREVVEYNTALGSTGIKIWGLSPDDPEFVENIREVAEEVESRGNKLIIHSTPLKQAKLALQLGAKLLVHSVEDQLVDDEFIQMAKDNGTYYNPTLIVSRGYFNTTNAVMGEEFDLQDPNNVLDEKTRDLLVNASQYASYLDTTGYRQYVKMRKQRMQRGDSIMAANVLKIHNAGIKVVAGTDAGNPGTLHGVSIFNELEAMQRAGIGAEDLIVIATKNGAEVMERSADFGTLEQGKIADLVILEEDPGQDISNMRSLTLVMRGGNLIVIK